MTELCGEWMPKARTHCALRRGHRDRHRTRKAWKSTTYAANHARVSAARGRAAEHACCECGKPAYDWAQITGTDGTAPEHYQPMCRRCHRLYDYGSDDRLAPIVADYLAGGCSLREISEKHGVDRNALRSYMRRHDIETIPRQGGRYSRRR